MRLSMKAIYRLTHGRWNCVNVRAAMLPMQTSHSTWTTIKMLQVLKHLYQRERLNFTAGILAREEDYTMEGPVTESAILELLKAGKESELHELYTNWTIDSD